MRTLIQALKTKELRNKILFTLGIIIIYRIGSFIPTPGVDYTVVQQCVGKMNNASENFIGLVNLFSGGAMLQLSIFALGVMPYITASIVIQLLRVVIPRFEALLNDLIVDAWGRNERTNTINDDDTKSEEDLVPQLLGFQGLD